MRCELRIVSTLLRHLPAVAALLAGACLNATAAFPDRPNVLQDREVISTPLTVSGGGVGAPIAVTGGSYSVGCTATYVTTPATVNDGQLVCVKHQSAHGTGRVAQTTLTIGGASHAFLSFTAPDSQTALIAGYYRNILAREADDNGLAYWNGQYTLMGTLGVDPDETWRSLAVTFFQSPEYLAATTTDAEYLTDLYATFFDRAPDVGGLSYWTGQLAAGMPRDVVLLSFLFSTEFDAFNQALFGSGASRPEVNLVTDLYRGILNRLPDAAGLDYWAGRLHTAQCTDASTVSAETVAVANAFLSSSEYPARGRTNAQYVADLYNAFLRRGADLAGFQYWVQRLDGGMARDAVGQAFIQSPEFQARIAQVMAQGCGTLADASSLAIASTGTGASPFIGSVVLTGAGTDTIASVAFTVHSKAGHIARPVHAMYSNAYLAAVGHGLKPGGDYEVPVFGLYAGYSNAITIDVRFSDGSTKTLDANVDAPVFSDPNHIFDSLRIVVPRTTDALDFDYMFVKSGQDGPLVLDTDGEVRWWYPAIGNGTSSIVFNNHILFGDGQSTRWRDIALDGTISDSVLGGGYRNTHHNLRTGKRGLLARSSFAAISM